jgi:hypothetical protein
MVIFMKAMAVGEVKTHFSEILRLLLKIRTTHNFGIML